MGRLAAGRRSAAFCAAWLGLATAHAQPQADDAPPDAQAAAPVAVSPLAEDAAIAARLMGILAATGWFEDADVRVDQGVVFLGGSTRDEDRKTWAGRLATNTQDVVAVVNQIRVLEPDAWDLSPALDELHRLTTGFVRRAPIFAIAAAMLVLTWLAARATVRGAGSLLTRKLHNQLLRDVAARLVAVPVFMIGLYLVLSVSGLTGLAVTVIGGTGLIGLVIGFAFREIAENFLASVLISIQRPFATHDLIEVAGHKGFVQSVNPRSTLLMTLDGNHVQIPNATVYKETITNFTANPITRYDFSVGIGYDDSINRAQEVALEVIRRHPAVIDDPEPLVLVETLGAATVNLRVYFWVDITKYSHIKVRSAVIRLTKTAFEQAGISMPDEAREVVFPREVPIRILSAEAGDAASAERSPPDVPADDTSHPASSAEGGLTSEAAEIERQARESRLPEGGANLLGS